MFEKIVSIITPLYNSASFFKETFDSVIGQTFKDWEWIIVDDCSTDNSFELVEGLIKDDKRIILLKTEKNSGTAAARNVGLKAAKGRYITFLDSDDLLDSNYLEEQLNFIKANGPLISCGYRIKGSKTSIDYFVPKKIDYNLELKGNQLSCLSTMFDREYIKNHLFMEDIPQPEDYPFWLNILKSGIAAKGNHKILATYVLHEGSRSSNKLKLIHGMYVVYHKTQQFNFFKTWYCIIRWAFRGRKKYKHVR